MVAKGKPDDTSSVADSAFGTASSGITAATATFTGVSQLSEVSSKQGIAAFQYSCSGSYKYFVQQELLYYKR